MTTDERNAATSRKQLLAWDTAPAGYRDIAYMRGPTGTVLRPFELTTWTGEHLARITKVTRVRRRGFYYTPYDLYYFRAVDRKGNQWHGTSPGPGMYARVRRMK